jgi:lipoprotein-anchoring transpeptidase ErfK/SrfK
MSSNLHIAEDAVRNAFNELRLGNKQAARSWAQRAIALAPDLETPWLILAAVAEPRASLEYLKEALKINPGSLRARQGLSEVQKRLENLSKVDLPQAPPTPQPPAQKKTSKSKLKWFGLFSISGLAIIAIVTLTMVVSQSGIVTARGLPASGQKIIVLQQMSTPTSTVTETPPPTDTPTDTPLPTPTDTPEPTATPTSTPSPAPTRTVAPEGFVSPQAVAPADSPGQKRIIVYISQQHLYAYQGDTLVHSFIVSTGASNSTRIGTFSILDKIPDAWSDPWGFWMPEWMGIYWIGYTENGIHALPVLPNRKVIWGDGLGAPISHGCVVLSTEDARTLFDWADVGTQVQILR